MSDVSVVIPAYNIREQLVRLIQSLENQSTDPGKFETIVVDDGSLDGTRQYLAAYVGSLDFKALFHTANRGRSAARNTGVKNASRKLILFLDGDVIAPTDLIARHVALHTTGSQAFIGGVRYSRRFGANGYTSYLETRGVMRLKSTGKVPPRYFLSGHSSVPKSSLETIGYFDETIEYGEDIDLGLRLAESGIDVFGVPDLVVIHQHVRCIEDTVSITEKFGFQALPVLCKKHPSLIKALRLDVLDNPGIGLRLLNVMFTKSIFKVVLRTVSILSGFRLPSAIYSYILYRSYLTGYVRYKKQNTN